LGLPNLHPKPFTFPEVTHQFTNLEDDGSWNLYFHINMMKLGYWELKKTKLTHQVTIMEQLF
jgi:hypothetical protein